MTDREERRAAAIKRAQAAHPQFTMDHIASVLDASGLLDDLEAVEAARVEAMERVHILATHLSPRTPENSAETNMGDWG